MTLLTEVFVTVIGIINEEYPAALKISLFITTTPESVRNRFFSNHVFSVLGENIFRANYMAVEF